MSETRQSILKVSYEPAPGSDVEHGQGAIERCELPHRPLSDRTWLIRVQHPADRELWQKRLNAAAGENGRFEVSQPSSDEQGRFDRGEIEFQQ